MSFTGNEGDFITVTQGSQWTANFRNSANFDGVKAQFYGKSKLNTVLRQTGCVGIRIYRAIDDTGAPVLVLVGVDVNENDMHTGYILEKGNACPPYCGGGGSPLQG